MKQQRFSHLTFLAPKHTASPRNTKQARLQSKCLHYCLVILGSLAKAYQSKLCGCSPPSFILPSMCLSKHLSDPAMSWFRKLSWQKTSHTKIIPQGGQGCSGTDLDRLAKAAMEPHKLFIQSPSPCPKTRCQNKPITARPGIREVKTDEMAASL